MAFQVSGVRQDEVGEGRRLRLEGVAHHQEGDLVLAVLVPVVEHAPHFHRVHGRVPGHVGHEDEQGIDAVGIAAPGIGDDVVHQAVHRQGVLPGEGLVDTHRRARLVHEQIVGLRRPAQGHAVQGHVGLDRQGRAGRLGAGRDGPREGRLVAEAAGAVDGAQQGHEHGERPYRLEAVGMGGQAAHGVEGDRVAGHRLVLLAPGIGPGNRQLDLVVARRHAHFLGQAADGRGGNAGDVRRPLGRVRLDALFQQLEGGRHGRAVGQGEAAEQVGIGVLAVGEHRLAADAVPPQLVLGLDAALHFRHLVAHEHAVLVALLVQVHQLPGIGVAHQEVPVVEALGDDFVDQGQQQRAVGARADRHPLVGHGRIAGTHRIHRDEAAALALELGDGDLQGVGVVVLGRAQHDEQLGPLQVGTAELPEGAADGVDHARRHVHRAEAAVGGVVGRAELAREQAGEGLHLVAPGEQGELLRVGGADLGQALGQQGESLLPADGLEFSAAALRARLAQQGACEARRRILLHDAAGALGADHALVQRMLGIAVDVADLAVHQVHADAAAAGAHVARGLLHLAHRLRGGLHGCRGNLS